MKKIPKVLADEMRREMTGKGVSREEQVRWFTWLRYYLDFCLKYQHSTRDPDTSVLYLQKLSSKGQSLTQQEQAGECIALFRKVAKRFPAQGKEQDQTEELTDWGKVLVSVQQQIRLRQYAKSTGRTYRYWVLQFQEFLNSKPVSEITDDDAVAFLSRLATHRRVVATTQNQAFNALLFLKCLQDRLVEHLAEVKAQFEVDLADGFAGAFMPEGSPTKWKHRALHWPWQYLFPAKTLTLVPTTGELRRYHIHDSQFSKALRQAVREAEIPKKVGAHTLRHSFASHLLLANYDIRTIQEMMGHSDVKTTMIYTQTVPSRTLKNRCSPLDLQVDFRQAG